jgi:hypothetical protein
VILRGAYAMCAAGLLWVRAGECAWFALYLTPVSCDCALISVVNRTEFLGAFAKLRKATVSFVTYVCSSALEQLGPHWADCYENLICEDFLKIC